MTTKKKTPAKRTRINKKVRTFLKDLLERAVKTFAEMMIADISVGQGFEDIDWARTLSVAGVATLISILMSLASYHGGDGTASLVKQSGI